MLTIKAAITIMVLISFRAYAPLRHVTLALKFYDMVQGTESDRRSAYRGFKKWPQWFGHTQREIYELVEKESEFKVMAYNNGSGARGLTQCRSSAFEDIAPPPGSKVRFFKYVFIGSNRVRVVNRKAAYRPWFNLYAGCAYYALCKRRARAQQIGKFKFNRIEIAKLYYVAGIGTWRRTFIPALTYAQQ